jgi:hypothetical protein
MYRDITRVESVVRVWVIYDFITHLALECECFKLSIVNIFLDVDVFYIQNKQRAKYVNLTSHSSDI